MKNRSGIQGVASSPVLVGAVTVLVVIVAVFLAYNANNGLPFVSTYDLKARVPNADALVKGNEVRIGGVRVGIVRAVVPVQLERRRGRRRTRPQPRQERRTAAGRLDDDHPARSRRSASSTCRSSPATPTEGFEAGETIPVAAARPEPVDIDEFFNMFDEQTRNAIRAEPGRLRQRLRRPRAAAERRLRRPAQPRRKRPADRCATWSRRAPTSPASGGRWRPSPPPSPRSPRPRPASSSPSTAPSPPSPASPAPTSRKRSQKGPPTLDAAIDDLPAIDPFLRNSGALLHRASQPGAKALADTSPIDQRALRRRHPGAQRLAGVQRPARADRRRAARLPGSARRLQRPRPADRHQRSPRTRRSGSSPRPRPSATT